MTLMTNVGCSRWALFLEPLFNSHRGRIVVVIVHTISVRQIQHCLSSRVTIFYMWFGWVLTSVPLYGFLLCGLDMNVIRTFIPCNQVLRSMFIQFGYSGRTRPPQKKIWKKNPDRKEDAQNYHHRHFQATKLTEVLCGHFIFHLHFAFD